MHLELRARHLLIDSRLRELCHRHLLYSLGRFDDHIRRVQLWIEDVNGPRGGRDLRCRLRICLRRGGTFSVAWLAERAEAAIDEVFDRGRAALLRRIQRKRGAIPRRRLRFVPSGRGGATEAELPPPTVPEAGPG